MKPRLRTLLGDQIYATRRILACLGLVVAVLLSLFPGTAVQAGPESWTTGGPADNIGTVAVAPGNGQVVYALGQNGLYRSPDGGNSWTLAGPTVVDRYAPLAIHPTNPNTLYSSKGPAGMKGIIKSTDGGATWTVVRPNEDATALAIDPTRPNVVFAGLIVGSGAMQIFKSVDSGTTWGAVTQQYMASPGIPAVVSIRVDSTQPDTVFAAMQSYHIGFVLRTTNGGVNWLNLGSGPSLMLPTAMAISPSPGGSTRVYVGWGLMGNKALTRSLDGGNTFSNISPALPAGGGSITSLAADGSTIIAAMAGASAGTGTPGGVFISSTTGDAWTPLGPAGVNIGRLAYAPDTRTIFVASDNGVWQYTLPAASGSIAVAARFQQFYNTYDGLRLLGAPISSPVNVGKYYSQYFEKGRIEDHTGESADPNWRFMYGLLVDELQLAGSNLPVGGDVSSVSYATIKGLAMPGNRLPAPPGFSGGIQYRADGAVFVPFTSDLSPASGHYVFGPFWDYINNPGLFPGGWLHDIGLPITEPVNAVVDKGNVKGRGIVIQAFQRTVLTYDPQNPVDWQVERANLGTDYKKAFPAAVPN